MEKLFKGVYIGERRGNDMEKLRITLAIGIGTTVIIVLLVSTISATEAANESAALQGADSAAGDQEKRHFTVACEMPGDTANFSWVEGNLATTVYYNNHCSHAVKVTAHRAISQILRNASRLRPV